MIVRRDVLTQDVKSTENSIVVNGDEVKIYAQKDPAQIPWKDHQVDVVLECTGFFTDKTKAEAHLKAGAKKVVISAPATGDLKTIVFNVNHNILDGAKQLSVVQAVLPTAWRQWHRYLMKNMAL